MKIQDAVGKYGIEKVKVLFKMRPVNTCLFFSFTSSSDPYSEVLCSLSEERYKMTNNYKITLVSDVEGFGKEDVYLMDLNTMISDGHAKLYLEL